MSAENRAQDRADQIKAERRDAGTLGRATDVVPPSDHPVTEYGTTRCPNEGWVAAEIDKEDGTCWACGEQVPVPPISPARHGSEATR